MISSSVQPARSCITKGTRPWCLQWQGRKPCRSALRAPRTAAAAAAFAPGARRSTLPPRQAAQRDTATAGSPLVACLQAVEVAALATAAAVQVGAAWRERQHQQQQHRQRLEPATANDAGSARAAAFAPPAPAGLQTTALVVALACGALLRRIHLSCLLPGGSARPTANAAVRLVQLEAALQQQQQQAGLMARQLDKLQTRTRLTAADAKSPLRQLQEACAGQADALAALAERGALLERRADATDEVVGALQAVGARQFKVCVDAIAAAKHEAADGAAKRDRELAALRSAVTQLQATWPRVQPFLSREGRGAGGSGNGERVEQQQQQWEVSNSSSNNGSSSSSSSRNGSAPDPWSSS